MTNDVYGVCVALIRKGTTRAIDDRNPSPVALGWKLESGLMPASAVDALRQRMSEVVGHAAVETHWIVSPAMQALLAEYELVRGAPRTRRASPGCPRPRRGPLQPTNCG